MLADPAIGRPDVNEVHIYWYHTDLRSRDRFMLKTLKGGHVDHSNFLSQLQTSSKVTSWGNAQAETDYLPGNHRSEFNPLKTIQNARFKLTQFSPYI